MNILLIAPNLEGPPISTVPDKYKDLSLGYYPPLGLLYLASYLQKFSRHLVKIIDMAIECFDLEDFEKSIKKNNPQLAGIYTTSFNINIVFKIVKLIKSINKDIIVVLGGPHIDIFSEESIALEGVDFVVLGEGEVTFLELLNSLEKNNDFHSIKGIIYKEKGEIKFNEKRPLIENLDTIPFPARDLTQYKKYYSLLSKNKISTTLMTSRGCPFRCNFCFVQYGGKYRMRSAENVIKEIEECIGLGIREFFFFDEIFTSSKSRVMDICKEIIKRKLDIIFDLRSRIDTIDEEMLYKLKEAGCARIQYGVESGSDEILKIMNKKITVRKAREIIKITKKAKIDILLDFMIGYPGENQEQIMRTINFAKELGPDYVQFGITTLFPGIKIYDNALKSGFLKEDFWKKVAKTPPEKILPPFASEKFSRQELEKFLRKAYLKFYFRPKYIFKRLFKVNTFTELLRQIKAGYHLLLGN